MSIQATKRLSKEFKQIEGNPPPFIIARPNEDNILDWHYVISGPPETPYAQGQFHGRITFPPEYPFKPPRIKMLTPSGRFEVNKRLCLSMSDFHEESWNPSWSVATILTGLLSFMTGDEATTGSITTSVATKHKRALDSRRFNCESNPLFRQVFPELYQENLKWLQEGGDKAGTIQTSPVVVNTDIDTGLAPTSTITDTFNDVNLDELDKEDRIRALKLKETKSKSDNGSSPFLYICCLILGLFAILYKFLL